MYCLTPLFDVLLCQVIRVSWIFLQSGQSYWTVTRLELLLGETGKRVCLHMPCVACCELCDLCEPDT